MSTCKIPKITLNNGRSIPIFGLGTWKSPTGEVTQAVKDAIDAGYRHIDCAQIYGNETEVGEAIKAKMADGTVKREELFITTKLWNTFHRKDLVVPNLKQSLSYLGVSYVDLYLMHWPMAYKEEGAVMPKDDNGKFIYSSVDFMEAWKSMEEAVRQGLAMTIGLSNFNKDQTERVIAEGNLRPAVLQVECHPYLPQCKLLAYCKSKGIAMTAYSPLGSPDRVWATKDDPVLMEDPKVVAIADKLKKTAAQLLIRYQIQRGVICIPKSVTKSRIESNLQVFDFNLSDEDMATITSFDCNGRLVGLPWVNDHPLYPFTTE